MRKLTFSTLIAVVLSLLAMPAMATDISQLWAVDTSSVTMLEGFLMTPSVTFNTPGLTGPPGGVLTQPNAQYALTTGGPWSIGTLYTVHINSPLPSFELDILEWNGGTLQENIAFFYNPSSTTGWTGGSYGAWYWNAPTTPRNLTLAGGEYDRSAVPEPLTLFLTGAGLVGLGLTKRWRKTQASG